MMTNLRVRTPLSGAGRPAIGAPGAWSGVGARFGLLALLLALPACGGDGTTGPGPSPPPPPPPPPSGSVTLNLAVGQVAVIDDPEELGSIHLEGAGESREYRIAIQSASSRGGARMPGTLMGIATSASGSVTGAVRTAPGGVAASASRAPRQQGSGLQLTDEQRSWLETVRLQERVRDELRRIGARAARDPARAASGEGAGPSLRAATSAVSAVGDTVEFFLPITEEFTLDCNDTTSVVEAEVRSVGERFLIARDIQGVDSYSDADYAEIQTLLDDFIYPVDTEYFGETADIDGNERVIVLITEGVNKLTEPTEKLIFLGFFLESDLAAREFCAASNVAEILYIRAPDPNGDFGTETTVERAIEFLQSTTSHEFQHLINAEQRSVLGNAGFASSAEVWMNEGLSHLAEEVVGLKVAGLPVRANIGIDEALADVDAFNTYLLDNFINVGVTSTEPDGCNGWMVDPESSITIFVSDPPGCGSITMRGWSYLFLRWLGDHEGPVGNGVIPGSNEQLLFRELVTGGPTHLFGRANVERAVDVLGSGASWEELMADFLVMPAVDDEQDVPERTQLLTWDLRDLFRGLHDNSGTGPIFPEEYPLKVESNLFVNTESDFSIRASSAKYFLLVSAGSTPDYEFRITDQAGGALPANRSPQVTIVRVR